MRLNDGDEMTSARDRIKSEIVEELKEAGSVSHDVRVQRDGTDSWKIAIVSDIFQGKDLNARKAICGIERFKTTWVDLLTSDEAQWAGQLPADIDLDEAPLWTEALLRAGQTDHSPVFASDLDQDIAAPAITTFYSLRGGVGRSTALANTARILASRGRKVVVIDMDLEAPGLASLLGVGDAVNFDMGTVEVLTSIDAGNAGIDLTKHLIRVGSDDLFCMPAGRASAEYARKLSLINPVAWYSEERNPLRIFFEMLRDRLPFKPDHILIDSRTGISPISGPLLFDVPDLAVIVFFPHHQAQQGTQLLSEALIDAIGSRRVEGTSLTPEPRFIASPVPGGDSFAKYEKRAREWVAEWVQPLNERRSEKPALLENEITHVIPYRESYATLDQVSSITKDWRDYEVIADWADRLIPNEQLPPININLQSRKDQILAELSFPTGTAESQSDLLETFVETDTIKKALTPDVPLIRGRKGTGKTALFRLLSEGSDTPAIKIVAPQPLQSGMRWTWSADAFRAVAEILERSNLNWEFFWSFFIGARCYSNAPEELPIHPVIQAALDANNLTEISIVEAFERIVNINRQELLIGEWLRQIDAKISSTTFLVFDGLDTGFGNTDADRQRRRAATEGLFIFLTDRASQFNFLRLKIVLREDIWRQLRFDNKSHLFGRDVSLSWREPEDFFKVVLIHARKSKSFRDVLLQDRQSAAIASSDPDLWSSEAISKSWISLIGERMKGSGTTYTQNWVWNRLADSNADRNPRYLLMLMNLVSTWEARENTRSRYDRSVIRPRALEQQLGEVSTWAVGALREEFEELKPLETKLANERTPFSADLVDTVSQDIVNLAQEVGLLGIYEEKDGSPERYAVPEIYRLALGMKRRGQA